MPRALAVAACAVTMFAGGWCHVASAAPLMPARLAAVDDAVRQAQSDPALVGAHIGVAVLDPSGGTLLYGHDADGAYIPASTLKLLTAATGLSVLGSGFRPRTLLQAAGAIHNGVLDGTLYLVGGGDPLLAESDLATAAAALRVAGVTEIRSLAVDQSAFSGSPYGDGWSWEDLAAYYAPPITALALEENALDVDVMPGASAGAPATVRVEEAYGAPFFQDDATTGPSGSPPTADCHLAPDASSVRVSGSVPLGGATVRQGCAVLDPSAFAAAALAGALQAHGVRVDALAGVEPAPRDARTV
ncbi:MAG: D-alanyl-D-alanine carboxypeptidase/D-alanyl-D-alanine-endopeptidase, partial [bacterium]|nr:D-alanyl-D-alanine carboxypeptidase/D-alanyl-D-alanine-endopeptidase [bacterium]